MPVEFDTYDPEEDTAGTMPRLTAGSNPQKILRFLAAHSEQGFTPKEISEKTDVPRGSVGTTLARLEEHELVRHKKPYWAIGEDDRLAVYAGTLHGLDAAADRFGEEDWGDWEEHAVDPRHVTDDG